MKIAFICDTPYQIVNCINYCYHLQDRENAVVDLYLGHQFFGSYELKERLGKENIFQNIYGFEDKNSSNKVIHYFRRMRNILSPRSYLEHIMEDEVDLTRKEYDSIFLSVPTMFAIAFRSLFKAASMNYYDDGLGSYYGNLVDRMNQSPQGRLCHIFGIHLEQMEAKALYVNNTALCKSTMTNDICPLPSMLHCSKDFLELLYRVFSYIPNPDYDKYRMIYLSQPNDQGDLKMAHQAMQIMKALQPYEKQCMVRPHPRQKELDTGKLFTDKTRGLWELLCADQITEDHILLGTFSTAQMIPKLLYQKEPYLIFMYQIEHPMSKTMNYSSIEQMIQDLRAVYKHPEKIKVPKDLSELHMDIEGILHEK